MGAMTKQEPAYEAESMAKANKLIDKIRKDLNRIQNVAKECIVGIDEYQNSLRSGEAEVVKDEVTPAPIKEAVESLDDIVLELAESPEMLDVDLDNLADSIRSAVTQTIGESVRSEMRDSVNAMRGRID